MALPPSWLDELRARTPMHALVARRVQLKKSGKNWTGCCPFHSEKSPSFYVYDDGFHCFGCGAHGDAITFVMQTQGATFIDAVESLAAEAGLEVPKQSPRAIEIEQERLGLHDILEAAQTEFVRLLHTPAGAGGLAYLRSRGLSDKTIARFGLGWSGDGRGSLTATLAKQGIDPARMEEAGLLRPQEDGPARELYWARVTFPIRDRRGRTISFGGRTLGDAKPKYINGPETRLFQKKQTLYALDLAREGARKAPPIVVEGYMDVIALHQAGFTSAVAPLGTALTAEQLELLWRMSPVPVLCFDGDAAGATATQRAAYLAMAHLQPDRSLQFINLPQGSDPDSYVSEHGNTAFQALLSSAKPLDQTVWEILDRSFGSTPEERARLLGRIDELSNAISDKNLSREYRAALRARYYEKPRARGKPWTGTSTERDANRPRTSPTAVDVPQERAFCLTYILLSHPILLNWRREEYEQLELRDEVAAIRDGICETYEAEKLDPLDLQDHLIALKLGPEIEVMKRRALPPPGSVRKGATSGEADAEWSHYVRLYRDEGPLAAAIKEATEDLGRLGTVAAERRLRGLVEARLRLMDIDEDV